MRSSACHLRSQAVQRISRLRITYDLAFDRIVHNAVWLEMGKLNMRTKLEGGSVPCGGSADGSTDEIRS